MGKFSFSKEERLHGRKDIQELFDRGSSFYLHPFKIIFLSCSDLELPKNQVLISGPSRQFGRAVDRNQIKRRIREAYRLNKAILEARTYRIAYIYIAKEILPSQTIRLKIRESLVTLNNRNEK
jgi:ribonuclease P protein component